MSKIDLGRNSKNSRNPTYSYQWNRIANFTSYTPSQDTWNVEWTKLIFSFLQCRRKEVETWATQCSRYRSAVEDFALRPRQRNQKINFIHSAFRVFWLGPYLLLMNQKLIIEYLQNRRGNSLAGFIWTQKLKKMKNNKNLKSFEILKTFVSKSSIFRKILDYL